MCDRNFRSWPLPALQSLRNHFTRPLAVAPANHLRRSTQARLHPLAIPPTLPLYNPKHPQSPVQTRAPAEANRHPIANEPPRRHLPHRAAKTAPRPVARAKAQPAFTIHFVSPFVNIACDQRAHRRTTFPQTRVQNQPSIPCQRSELWNESMLGWSIQTLR